MRRLNSLARWIKRMFDNLLHAILQMTLGGKIMYGSNVILVVRTDGIGDFLFSVRYIQLLRAQYEGHKVVLCCREETAELARSTNAIDDVLGFNGMQCRRNHIYRLLLLWKIRSVRPEVAIYMSYHRENIGDEMTLFSGATTTVAFSGNDECIHPQQRLRNNLEFTDCVLVPDHTPERDKYGEMLLRLGCSISDQETSSSFEPHVKAAERTKDSPISVNGEQRRYAILGPGGSSGIRRWPADRFAALGDRLSADSGVHIVLCGNRGEHGLMESIRLAMKYPADTCSRLTLLETTSLMKSASLFVGNESGLLHLAAALKIPSIGILGGGHFSRYFPYGSVRVVNHFMECYECNWTCRYPEPYCLTNITVDDVMKDLKKLFP